MQPRPPIPVIVASRRLCGWRGLSQCFSLEAGFALCCYAGAAVDLGAHCAACSPCVVIVDEAWLDGLDEREMQSLSEAGRLLVLTEEETFDSASRVVQCGGYGLLSGTPTAAMMRKSVEAVMGGEVWMSRRMLSQVVQNLVSAARSRLTPREMEILRLIGQGFNNREIASELYISRETVRWHVRAIYTKIGVHDRRAAILYCSKHFPETHAGHRLMAPAPAAAKTH